MFSDACEGTSTYRILTDENRDHDTIAFIIAEFQRTPLDHR